MAFLGAGVPTRTAIAAEANDNAPAAIERVLAEAQSALQQNNPAKAADLFRQVLQVQPTNDDAYQALCAVADRLPLSADSSTFRDARQLLPRSFVEFQTRRFIALSNGGVAWTRSQLELLERAHHQFLRFTTRLGLRPLPLRHKLVCIMFATRDEYVKFAQQHDDLPGDWSGGHYSPQHDWIVFFDVQSVPLDTRNQDALDALRRQKDNLVKMADAAAAVGRDAEAAGFRRNATTVQSRIDDYQQLIGESQRRESTATSIHEAIHQLMFHTQVQTPHARYPLWICEGLATCFETDSPLESFGPDRDYQPRREQFQQILARDSLIPLSDLVQLDAAGDEDNDRISAIYNQSYALVAWMCRFRKAELKDYLTLMLTQTSGDQQPPPHRELFERAFGDVKSLERAWLRYERNAVPDSASATAN